MDRYSPYRGHGDSQLINGASLQNKSIHDYFLEVGSEVVGVIDLQNKTDYELTRPKIKTSGGRCSVRPQTSVRPDTQGIMVVNNNPGTVTGSYGTVSYYLRELDRRVVLMWSLPYNLAFYSNWLAIDIRQGEELDHNKLFDAMYYRNQGQRTKYNKYIGDTTISDGDIAVVASMDKSHQSHIKLKIEKVEGKA